MADTEPSRALVPMVDHRPLPKMTRGIGFRGPGVSHFNASMMRTPAAPYQALSDTSPLPTASSIGPTQIAYSQTRLRRTSRQMDRNDPTLRKAFNQLAESVVGTGPRPRSKFRDLDKLWRIWTTQTDPTNRLPFGLQLRSAYRDAELTGDSFIRIRQRRPEDGLIIPLQLQLLEGEYVPIEKTESLPGGNRIVNGIELDLLDRPVAYWSYRAHPDDVGQWNGDNSTLSRVPVGSMLHIGRPARNGGYRGETRAVAALINLWRLHGYVDSEMARKQVVSMLAGFIKSTNDESAPQLPGQQSGDEGLTPEEEADGLIDVLEWQSGQLFHLPAGLDITFPTVQDTSGNAAPFLRFLQLIIASGVDVPDFLLFGADGLSDRVVQQLIMFMNQMIQGERFRLEHQACNPIRKMFVDACVATGLWTPPSGIPQWEWYEVEWAWDELGFKHPLQDVKAKIEAIDAGLVDRDTIISQGGASPEDVDYNAAIAAARRRLYGLTTDSVIVPPPQTGDVASEGDPESTDPVKGAPMPGGQPQTPQPRELTEIEKRIEKIVAAQINRMLDDIEQSELDRGAYGPDDE